MMAQDLSDVIRGAVTPLPPLEDSSFGSYFDTFGSSRIVLIGESSHGTSEFYRARAAITKRLIEEHGFNIVAIEADWPDARAIDHYVRQHPRRGTGVPTTTFGRFPRWVWRNIEVQEFVDWLREHNARLPPDQRTSFNGLDLYSMEASTKAVIEYLERNGSMLAILAKQRYGCLEPWFNNPKAYGASALAARSTMCEQGVVEILRQLLASRIQLASAQEDGESFMDAEMNARVVCASERYFRSMFAASYISWNMRDEHMFDVLSRLLKLRPGSKAVVWAHNSHLGDARHSIPATINGRLNLGQLCRQKFNGEVSIIGCGTHTGTVAAADSWGQPMKIMDVRPSRPDSYEGLFHATGIPSFLLDTRGLTSQPQFQRFLAKEPLLQRLIGVSYWPNQERQTHYVHATLSKQYDGFVWFDRTSAVHAFETAQPREPLALGETYPFGM